MSVTAIVINFNAGASLQRCIAALTNSTVKPAIHVIDNASTDGSAQQLRGLYGNQSSIEILDNPSNIGYAAAVNASLKGLHTDRVLIINPDCFIHKDALKQLQSALDGDDKAALAAPAVIDGSGKLEKASLRRFPDPWKSLMTMTGLWRLGSWLPLLKGVPFNPASLPETNARAEAVSGACMLIRRSALLEVGFMDESYGLHCEDLDLMYRIKEAGWHCLFVPGASAVHTQGVSSKSRPFWVHRQKHKGMSRFFKKFQAAEYWPPVRWLVYTGIWARYMILLPLVWLKK